MARTILIVDDEPDICEILRFNLEMEGYEVDVAEGPDEGQKIVNGKLSDGKCVDLILLDVMMTPKSGFEWARELKADRQTADIPIIFCTAKTLEEDLLLGFALGSDDYICKPFRISEVKARVKAVLRRRPSPQRPTPVHPGSGAGSPANEGTAVAGTSNSNADAHRTLVYTPLCALPSDKSSLEGQGEGPAGILLDLDRKECFIDGKEVVFTKLEFEVLALLLSRPGQVFSREKILQTVWPSDTIVLDRTVDVNITRIRKKIGRYGECLRTKFGYGYLFNA